MAFSELLLVYYFNTFLFLVAGRGETNLSLKVGIMCLLFSPLTGTLLYPKTHLY